MMTVGKLKKLIQDMPDDLPILAPGSDHSYMPISFFDDTARYDKDENYYCEDHGDEQASPEELQIRALIGHF